MIESLLTLQGVLFNLLLNKDMFFLVFAFISMMLVGCYFINELD